MNIVFSGNRQCEYITSVFRTLASQHSELSVFYVSDDGDLPHRSIDAIQSADVLVLQERDAVRNFDVDEFNKNASRYSIPEISIDFLWPFGGQPHVLNLPSQQLPHGPFPATLGDAYLNRRIQTHFSPELLSEYVSLQVDCLIDLDVYKASVLERQGRIDQASGTDWASTIHDNLRQRPILRNPLQPTPWVLSEIFSQLLARMNLEISFADSDISRACATAPELPVHPSIARYFDLSWASDGQRYQLRDGDRVSFIEYTRRYLSYAEGAELEIGVRAIATQTYELALDNLRRAVQRPLGRGSVTAQCALAHALMEKGDGEEALDALTTASSIEPENTEVLFASARILAKLGRPADAESKIREYVENGGTDASAYVALADIHTANGKHREASQALRAALARPDANAGLQSRLTLALARSGDLNGAVESAETEIKLAPDSVHPRAFLSELLVRIGKPEAAKSHAENALTIIKNRPGLDGLRESLRSLYCKLPPPLRDDLL